MTLDLNKRDRCFIIGEAGTCHASDNTGERRMLAHRYVAAAADAGVDAIKFQMFDNPIRDDMFCWIDGDEEREPRWSQSVLSLQDWRKIKHHAEERGIMFLASTFQHATVRWLNELGVAAIKVASRAAENFPYHKALDAPYLISTGMHIPPPTGPCDIYLQCEAKYPSTKLWTPGGYIGFSDHSGHPMAPTRAVMDGCELLEVHFYIDEEDAGPDLPASLTTEQLKLVCDVRDAFVDMMPQRVHAA